MSVFDWNGNRKVDTFDHFMDMEVMSDAYDDSDMKYYDSCIEETDKGNAMNDIDISRANLIGTLRKVSTQRDNDTTKLDLSFQEQLKENMRTPEIVREESTSIQNEMSLIKAKNTLCTIKRQLIENAQNAKYTISNGNAVITCYCTIPGYFMSTHKKSNVDELRRNNQKFIIFRDPTLVYKCWNCYEINEEHSDEYWQYISALKKLAAKENISIEPVVYNKYENKVASFPSKVKDDYSTGWTLSIKATTSILTNQSGSVSQTNSLTTYEMKETVLAEKIVDKENSISNNTEESDETAIAKSLISIGICVGTFIMCISSDIGGTGMALLLIGAAFVGYHIMKS